MIEGFWGLCFVHCYFIKDKMIFWNTCFLCTSFCLTRWQGRIVLTCCLPPDKRYRVLLCLSMDPSEADTLPGYVFVPKSGSLLQVGGVGWDRCPSEAASAVFMAEHSSSSFQASAQRYLSTFGWCHWKNSGSQGPESPQCSAELRTFISEAASSKSMAEGWSDL